MTNSQDGKSIDTTSIAPPPPPVQPINDGLTTIQDTHNTTFAYVSIVFETMYMFVKVSCELFLLHGLARFVIDRKELDILQDTAHIKFIASFYVIPWAILCDSYLGKFMFYIIMSGLCALMIMPSLYFIMSFPAYMLPANEKLNMYFAVNIIHGLNYIMEPLRVIIVLRAILSRYRFPSNRYFCAILVFGWKFATVAAAGALYVARSSRVGYSVIMVVNIVCLGLYISFILVFKYIFFPERKQNYFCVEKAFANIVCYSVKKIDQLWCKQRTFKTPGWQDFRSFRFSEITAMNAHGFVGVLIVMIPLVSYFVMEEVLEFYYSAQFPMLKYDTEAFSALGLESAFYCLISPPFEYLILRVLNKRLKHRTGLQLTFVGIGVFFYAIAFFWCSVVQHKLLNKMDYLSFETNIGHVVLVNAASATVTIRGKYFNEFMSWPEDNWVELIPWEPLKILHIPETEMPFKVTISCKTFAMYDDHELPVDKLYYNWFMVYPHGVEKLPVGYLHSRRDVAIKPELYNPATVNVICRIPICAGVLIFKKTDQLSIQQVIEPLKDMMSLELVGKYQMSFQLVGNDSNALIKDVKFERLGIYLLVIHEEDNNENITLTWHEKEIMPTSRFKTSITTVGNTVPRYLSRAYMYPSVFIHAIGETFAKVSVMTWLYLASPMDLKVLCFSLTAVLAFPYYAYAEFAGCPYMQQTSAVVLFSFACGCCFVTVLYFFAALYQTHRWNTGKNAPGRTNDITLDKKQDRKKSQPSEGSKEA